MTDLGGVTLISKLRTARLSSAAILVAVVLLALGTPRAFADTISLMANNLGLAGSVGTITLTQNGVNDVRVDILMAPGFSLKDKDGNDVNFNANATNLTVKNFSGKVLSTGSWVPMTANVNIPGSNADGYGTFGVSLAHLDGLPQPNIASITEFRFDVAATGLIPTSLEVPNNPQHNAEWAVHFCDGPAPGCAVLTGYAANAGAVAGVPEPGTLALFGVGLISLAGFLRRSVRPRE